MCSLDSGKPGPRRPGLQPMMSQRACLRRASRSPHQSWLPLPSHARAATRAYRVLAPMRTQAGTCLGTGCFPKDIMHQIAAQEALDKKHDYQEHVQVLQRRRCKGFSNETYASCAGSRRMLHRSCPILSKLEVGILKLRSRATHASAAQAAPSLRLLRHRIADMSLGAAG